MNHILNPVTVMGDLGVNASRSGLGALFTERSDAFEHPDAVVHWALKRSTRVAFTSVFAARNVAGTELTFVHLRAPLSLAFVVVNLRQRHFLKNLGSFAALKSNEKNSQKIWK